MKKKLHASFDGSYKSATITCIKKNVNQNISIKRTQNISVVTDTIILDTERKKIQYSCCLLELNE